MSSKWGTSWLRSKKYAFFIESISAIIFSILEAFTFAQWVIVPQLLLADPKY